MGESGRRLEAGKGGGDEGRGTEKEKRQKEAKVEVNYCSDSRSGRA